MFVVHFLENRTILLSQLLKSVPAVGDNLIIKGRKGKVSEVKSIDDKHIHVQISLDSIKKNKPATEDSSKKKKR